MKPENFFYWLQGHFELGALGMSLKPLNQAQAKCIIAHAELVPQDERGQPLKDIMLLAGCIRDDDSYVITNKIKSIVHDTFEHVIDPKAGDADEQARLNKIHSRPVSASQMGRTIARC